MFCIPTYMLFSHSFEILIESKKITVYFDGKSQVKKTKDEEDKIFKRREKRVNVHTESFREFHHHLRFVWHRISQTFFLQVAVLMLANLK